MPIVSGNTTLQGATNISGSGTTYGIVQDSVGRVRFPLNPCFFAYDHVNTGSNVNLVWRQTRVNVGGHYNTSNGRFTAPIAGTYFFQWSNIGNNSSTVTRYRFYRNGTNWLGGNELRLDHNRQGGPEGYGPNGVKATTIFLNAGDFVNINFRADNGTTDYFVSGIDEYQMFAGWLVG